MRLEAAYDFTLDAFYVRTYHNEVADWLTRELEAMVHSELEEKGWEKLDPPEEWGQLMEEAKDRLLRLSGEKGDAAHAARRRPSVIPSCAPRLCRARQ